MASLSTMTNIPIAFKASKKHKNKKTKKEKKDKSKKSVPDFLFNDSCHEAVFTQMQDTTKRKKPKKKSKLKEDFQQPKLNKQPKQPKDTHQIQPVICISPDQETPHSTEKECYRSTKRKKRVIFNLPPEQSQAAKTNVEEFGKKQLVGESSLESNTAEEMNSQDLFITQKSFLDPYVEISSGSSCSEATAVKALENHAQRSRAEATTQTENFFTLPALSTSLRFLQQQSTSESTEEPVDLSLPNRTRQLHGSKQSTVDSAKPPKLKISDTSSEDGDTAPKAKGDLLQLKVIQTRLNESFFFKVKGEDSPKPMCPLMKLTESVEKKTKK
ncbi:THO complex subunit 2-like protein [Labeo rohita]|uniref:THO complex subunit 2-like protein n=1 Tax=Labeo rohita TaxID=84645 RepID=A0A498MDN9_LABRO|nr:THO complex subunit 2-like protein [Labeo rohita]